MTFDYSNRSMSSASSARRSGHPSGGNCPKCGKPLYYAERLLVHDGEKTNVDYCSGGCGFTRSAGNDAVDVDERVFPATAANAEN